MVVSLLIGILPAICLHKHFDKKIDKIQATQLKRLEKIDHKANELQNRVNHIQQIVENGRRESLEIM